MANDTGPPGPPDRTARAAQKSQRAAVLWFTGLSGAGKTTIASLVDQRLFARGRHCAVLDGDTLRQGLNRDLGFSAAHRAENVRRVAAVAALFVEAGLIAIVAVISPNRAERQRARAMLPDGEFLEVFVDTALQICVARDVKGLYRRALAGELADFTGISAPYEPPLAPDIHLRTADGTAQTLADAVIDVLLRRGLID